MRCLESITNSMDMNWRKLRQTVEDGGAWCDAVHGVTKNHSEQQCILNNSVYPYTQTYIYS